MTSNKKNKDDHIMLPGRWLKIDGSISNTSVGPCSGDTPKENTAGKMITPASIAIRESNNAVEVALFTRGVSFWK